MRDDAGVAWADGTVRAERSGPTYFQYLFNREPTFPMMRTWGGDAPCLPFDLSEYGLNENEVAEKFCFYTDCFAVPTTRTARA